MSFIGQCKCANIIYNIPHLPNEIANCYCNICKKLHNTQHEINFYVSFAKYDILGGIIFSDTGSNLILKPSSNRASRGYCKICDTSLFMHYNKSKDIWINAYFII